MAGTILMLCIIVLVAATVRLHLMAALNLVAGKWLVLLNVDMSHMRGLKPRFPWPGTAAPHVLHRS